MSKDGSTQWRAQGLLHRLLASSLHTKIGSRPAQRWDHLEDAVKADRQAARDEAARPTRRGCSGTDRTTPDPGSAKSRHRQSTRLAVKAAMRMVRTVISLGNV